MKYRSDGAYSCRTELPSERLVAGHPPGIADCLPLPVSPPGSANIAAACMISSSYCIISCATKKCSEITDRRAGYIFHNARHAQILSFSSPTRLRRASVRDDDVSVFFSQAKSNPKVALRSGPRRHRPHLAGSVT
jgi:hypothetical protein